MQAGVDNMWSIADTHKGTYIAQQKIYRYIFNDTCNMCGFVRWPT